MPLKEIANDRLALCGEQFDEMNLHCATSRTIVMLRVFLLSLVTQKITLNLAY